MLTPALLVLAAAALPLGVGLRRCAVERGLIVRDPDGGLVIGDPRALAVVGLTAVGALAFWGGGTVGSIIGGGGGTGTPPAAEEPGGGGAIDTLVIVDWATATGTSSSARRDGTALGFEETCTGEVPASHYEVVAASSVPGSYSRATNVLRLVYDPDGCFNVGSSPMYPAPEAGAVWKLSVDVMLDEDDGSAHNLHGPISRNPVGTLEGDQMWVFMLSDSTYSIRFYMGERISAPGSGYPYWEHSAVFHVGVWYQLQLDVVWTSGLGLRIYPDWYDIAGDSLYSAWETAECLDGCDVQGSTLLSFYQASPDSVFTYRNASADSIRAASFAIAYNANASGGHYHFGCARFGTAIDTLSAWPVTSACE